MRLDWAFFGKETGNFRQDQLALSDFISRVRTVRSVLGLKTIFSPAVGFTNEIAVLSRHSEAAGNWILARWFVRSSYPADGALVQKPRQAVAIFSADCPVAAVLERKMVRLAALHIGFRNLVRENHKEKNIIERLFSDFSFDPREAEVLMGFGIGPCCFGAEHYSEVRSGLAPLPLSRAIRGPRKGQHSVDLCKLAKSEFLKLGVPSDQIWVLPDCTACNAGYYSNCREGKETGRNAALFWFDI